MRESPALDIIELLQHKQAKVCYHDPYIPFLNINSIKLKNRPLSKEGLGGCDLVILCTDHSCFNYKDLAAKAERILDTRNAFGRRRIESKQINRL